jgi:hypothetical protein
MHKRTSASRVFGANRSPTGSLLSGVTTEELPPRLLVTLKKLDEEVDPSAEQVEVIRDIES